MIYDKPSVIRITTPEVQGQSTIAQMLQGVADSANAGYQGYLDDQQRQMREQYMNAQMQNWQDQRANDELERQQLAERMLLDLQARTSQWEDAPESATPEQEPPAPAWDSYVHGLLGTPEQENEPTPPLAPVVKEKAPTPPQRTKRKPMISELTVSRDKKMPIAAPWLEDTLAAEKAKKEQTFQDSGKFIWTQPQIDQLPEEYRPFVQPGMVGSFADVDKMISGSQRGADRDKAMLDTRTGKMVNVSQRTINADTEGRYQPPRSGVNINLKQPGGAGGLDTSDKNALIDAVLAGDIGGTELGRGKERIAILAAAAKREPGFTTAKYNQRVNMRKSYANSSTSSDGGQVEALGRLAEHLQTLREGIDALHSQDPRVVNTFVNKVRDQFGSPEINNYQIASQAIASEVSKILKGGIAGETEIKDWEKRFAPNASPQQQAGAVATVKSLVRGQLKAKRQRWIGTMGPDREEEWRGYFTPEALALLDEGKKKDTKVDVEGFLRTSPAQKTKVKPIGKPVISYTKD